MAIDEALKAQILEYQRNEITEHHIYQRLAETMREPENARIVREIADDELRHYEQWKTYTGQEVKPRRFQVWKYVWISRILGFTFGIKLMERGEESAQTHYGELAGRIPQAQEIAGDENKHEETLIEMLDEERLRYTGSIVLGLNDALVELTGALAGLTLALRDTRLIALTGSITGIAAFTYYIGVARDEPFRRRFLEMAGLSLGVAGLSFVVGLLVRTVLGVDV
jgi:VIT1/CCC1 family predicted Fe2+/Mn2+ transporter